MSQHTPPNCPDCLLGNVEIVPLTRDEGTSKVDWVCVKCGYRYPVIDEKIPEVNGYASARGMAAAAPLRAALEWHLQSNHFPPVPSYMVPVAERAVLAARAGNYDESLPLPPDVLWRGNSKVPVSAVVESFHLDAFIDAQEEDRS